MLLMKHIVFFIIRSIQYLQFFRCHALISYFLVSVIKCVFSFFHDCSSDLSIGWFATNRRSWISGIMPASCLHGDTLFLSGTYVQKGTVHTICSFILGIKKGHVLLDTAWCLLYLRKRKPPQTNVCEGLFLSAYQFYHARIFIVIPFICQCATSLLPIYFHFSSSLIPPSYSVPSPVL